MLVTFRTRGYPDITMFSPVARELLLMMGHSGDIPGALGADDVANSLGKLRERLATLRPEPDETDRPVPIHIRAHPLVELLETAARSEDHVMWH
jgi:hypothetical protein